MLELFGLCPWYPPRSSHYQVSDSVLWTPVVLGACVTSSLSNDLLIFFSNFFKNTIFPKFLGNALVLYIACSIICWLPVGGGILSLSQWTLPIVLSYLSSSMLSSSDLYLPWNHQESVIKYISGQFMHKIMKFFMTTFRFNWPKQDSSY